MAKGITAAPKKRKKKRLSEHAQLVEERARSIPPGVVHELFDTSTLPVPPPAPHRHGAPGRLVSKPPPPPRPSQPPEDAEEAELEDLEGAEDIDELEEIDPSEESHSDVFGSHTISPSTAPEPRTQGEVRGRSPRSRVVPALLGVALVGALALVTGRELGRSRSAGPRVESTTAATTAPERTPALPSPPAAPVTDDLPLLPPGAVVEATPAPGGAATEAPAAASSSLPLPDGASLSGKPALLAAASPRAGRATADPGGLPPFDGAVADAAIVEAFRRAQVCRGASEPKGSATVTLTYAPSGRVTTALVSGIFAGTSVGSCIAATLRSARIAPFTGALVTVKRTTAFE